jgi:O-antigen ligase
MRTETVQKDSFPEFPDYRENSIRWYVIAGVMAITALIAPLAAVRQLPALAFFILLGGSLGLITLVRWPGIGFPITVVVSLLVPFSIGTGTQTAINVTVIWVSLLAGLWILEILIHRAEVRLVGMPTVWPLFALMASSVLAFGFGQLHWLPTQQASLMAQIGGLTIFLLSPMAFLLAAYRIRSIKMLEWMTWLFVGLGGLYIFCLLVPGLSEIGMRMFQRAVRDSMFWTWIITIAFCQSLLNKSLHLIWRILSSLIVVGAFYYTMASGRSWISGWFPGLISILTITIILKPKWVLGGLGIAGLLFLVQPQLLDGLFRVTDNMYSLVTRIEAWKILFTVIKYNPLLGLGPANYYWYTPIYRILGYSVSFNSHNNYVDILAQIGVIGLMCFIWFAWALLKQIWRIRTYMPEGFPRAYIYGAFGGFVATLFAMLLGDWVLPFVYNVGLEGFRATALVWMFLGGVVALKQILSNSRDSLGESESNR